MRWRNAEKNKASHLFQEGRVVYLRVRTRPLHFRTGLGGHHVYGADGTGANTKA